MLCGLRRKLTNIVRDTFGLCIVAIVISHCFLAYFSSNVLQRCSYNFFNTSWSYCVKRHLHLHVSGTMFSICHLTCVLLEADCTVYTGDCL